MEIDMNLFDLAFPEEVERRRKESEEAEPTCKHDWRNVDGMKTCIECGIVNLFNFTSEKYVPSTYKNYHIYLRSHYFREKLLLLGGFKQCIKDGYNDMLKDLRTHNIQSITYLRRVMKQKGYSKFYKYIYNIFYELTGEKVIDLTRERIDFLMNKYIQFEKLYKKMFHKNPNYSVVMICLLQKYGYNTYRLLCSKTAKLDVNRIQAIFELL